LKCEWADLDDEPSISKIHATDGVLRIAEKLAVFSLRKVTGHCLRGIPESDNPPVSLLCSVHGVISVQVRIAERQLVTKSSHRV
jgi:hypothetical protein